MDEILVFGKSHTLRVNDGELDDNNRDMPSYMLSAYKHDVYSMFKMEPLFFGYIETISKTYDASRGCMITVTAKDHMKLLELSQVVTNGGSLINHIMPSIDYSLEYGLASFQNPIGKTNILRDGAVRIGTEKEELIEKTYSDPAAKAADYSFLFTSCMTGLYIDEIVQIQAAAAGVPTKFLTKRIEPMHKFSPFWQSALRQNMDFFKGQTESRYSLCQKACQMLLLEFFADEEGNIVVKIPNWVLGANYLQANNCNIRYYDDMNHYEPKFYQNPDGTLGVESNSGAGEDASGGGGLGGLLGAIFGGLMDALAGIFSTIFSGKSDEERIIAEPNSDVSDTNPNRDISRFIDNIRKAKLRQEEAEEKEKKKGGLLGPFQDAFDSLSDLIKFEHTETEPDINTETIDYSYAGITDEIIRDAIDKDNENVVQVDEYKIKIKVSPIHDDKFGSLYSIAKYCYNNPYKWHLIAELNDIYEPTEINEGQWLEIYSNEPISDFIVNSSSIDSLELQELKYLRRLRLQNLYKTNANEITVCNMPFIKGEFISFPRSLRSTHKKINFSQKYKTTLSNKKKFFIPKNKITNIDNKIIHCNEADIDNIIKASAYINNGYLLSDYNEIYDPNTNTWKITLTIPQDIDDEELENKNYSLSDYQSDNLYNVILTIEEDQDIDIINDDKYILSSYQENKKGNGDTEIILTILDKTKSTIPQKTDTSIITPIPINYVNDVDHSIKDQEKDPLDKLHPKHGISITEKRVQDREVPKPISKDKIIDEEQAEEDSGQGPQHVIPTPTPEQEGRVTDNLGPDTDYYRNTERAAKERSNRAKAVSRRITQLGDSVTAPREVEITEDDSEKKKYDKPDRMFRSQRTDLDIPVIPNEYIISFTLTDSDQEVYNFIEVGGSQAFAIQQGASGSLPSIFRNIPDFENIVQFGLRPHPVLQCSPLVQDANEAIILGACLLYKSQLNRYSGVLTCIEDSMIRVGNPIRIYLYDEHPYPLARRFGSNGTMTEEEYKNAPPYFSEKYYKEQAVFYVESISRNIDVQNVSTMTLQLKNGRVMGMTNPGDILSIFFNEYYDSYQSRNYYYKKGNNTATVALHSTDLSGEIQAHKAAQKPSKWINTEFGGTYEEQEKSKTETPTPESSTPKAETPTPESGTPTVVDDLGNYKDYDGLPDNIINPEDDIRVARDKKKAQEEWLKEHGKDTPTETDMPENPDTPKNPESDNPEPETPETPKNPESDNPDTPENPNPENPNPETPENPNPEPENPDPDNPDKPDTPDKPENPKPDVSKKKEEIQKQINDINIARTRLMLKIARKNKAGENCDAENKELETLNEKLINLSNELKTL